MNPPLDVTAPPASAPPASATLGVAAAPAPFTVHDLRGGQGALGTITGLRYPPTAALVFAGVPGAGKSTALLRFFGSDASELGPPTGPDGRIVIDSQHARNRWSRRLRRLPYPLWRPVVQLAHYATIRRALRTATGPVIIHDCGTFRWSRRLLARWAAAHRRSLHVVMIDVTPTVAKASQVRRGRRSSGLFFDLHCRRWAELVGAVTGSAPARATSVVIADRAAINRLTAITFDS